MSLDYRHGVVVALQTRQERILHREVAQHVGQLGTFVGRISWFAQVSADKAQMRVHYSISGKMLDGRWVDYGVRNTFVGKCSMIPVHVASDGQRESGNMLGVGLTRMTRTSSTRYTEYNTEMIGKRYSNYGSNARQREAEHTDNRWRRLVCCSFTESEMEGYNPAQISQRRASGQRDGGSRCDVRKI